MAKSPCFVTTLPPASFLHTFFKEDMLRFVFILICLLVYGVIVTPYEWVVLNYFCNTWNWQCNDIKWNWRWFNTHMVAFIIQDQVNHSINATLLKRKTKIWGKKKLSVRISKTLHQSIGNWECLILKLLSAKIWTT